MLPGVSIFVFAAASMTKTVPQPILSRRIGQSDLVVSECCLGGMTWGEQNTDDDAAAQLSLAFDNGVNFIDTAEGYPVPMKPNTQGLTDLAIAKWMRNTRQPRDSMIITTKVCGYNDRYTWFRDDGVGTQLSKAQIRESVDKSLARLSTDYIDLLQFHWPERPTGVSGMSGSADRSRGITPVEEQVEAIGELLTAGKIRHWGLSNENAEGLRAFQAACEAQSVAPPVAVSNAYSLLQRQDERDLLSALGADETSEGTESSVAFLPYSPLSGGVLSGKYSKTRQQKTAGLKPKRSRLRLVRGYEAGFLKSKGPEAVEAYVQVARKHGITPSQLAIAMCNSRSFVASTVVGATSAVQLAENLRGFCVEWSAELEADVVEVHERFPDPWRVQVKGMG